jgi:cytochrome c556
MKTCCQTLLALALTVSTSAFAEEAKNYIKYRQAMMKAIGGHTGAASQIIRGKVNAKGDLVLHAKALADLNAHLTRLFPEGSDFGETKAKVEIWEQWDKFQEAALDSKNATAALDRAVAEDDATKIGDAMQAVGRACKGCHKEFREKDE